MTLAATLKPCGPVVDRKAAERIRRDLGEAAAADGWSDLLDQAWPALAPVFSASPYLAGLARSEPDRLRRLLANTPDQSLRKAMRAVARLDGEVASLDDGAARLRALKKDVHLLTALSDLGGLWPLETVTGALSALADAAVQAAMTLAARDEIANGRLNAPTDLSEGPVPGLFVLAMGKHGAAELNYSSDIDISFFYEPEALLAAGATEAQDVAVRLAKTMSRLLQERTRDGYVFRVDLRLRPDPSATPPAVPAAAAFEYYQAVGQNWERAAFIKARPCAGDIARGWAFLEELKPFVWRRSLDYAAIADVHSIKRQIHVHKTDERLTAPGANVKLGAGGIREIEFYVQTQQLILGGRDPGLRSNRTLDALAALAAADHVDPKAAEELASAYRELRTIEHRIQMISDEQTHRLPEADAERRRVAALYGEPQLRRFDARVSRILKSVNRRYGELFADDESLSSRFGSLVFTGVEDDPETLLTLERMGFSNPAQVAATIRSWHHGRIPATRGERGRELFTRLAPRLLDAFQATGAPDVAFNRFADFFSRLSAGVQVQSMLLAEPELLDLVVKVLALAPRLSATLARKPAVLDSLIDRHFFAPLSEGRGEAAFNQAVAEANGFESAMDAVRRIHHEQAFRIGVQVLSGRAKAAAAGLAYSELAESCIGALAPAALAEATRLGGAFPGEVAVIALGKCGAREMTAASDLDLMTLYDADDPVAMSEGKGWGAETFYARFTQRLVAALSAPTAEGGLYEVDLQLRPSGTSGPVAVSFKAFDGYYEHEAETWELMALTRARVVWASSPDFAARAGAAVEHVLRRPREAAQVATDVREMRALMEREKPAKSDWDLKLLPGGLVDIEFAAQHLQIANAGSGGPISPNTGAALEALAEARLAPSRPLAALRTAWTLQQNLSQLLKAAIDDDSDPDQEPDGFRRLLARAGGAPSYEELRVRLDKRQAAAREAFEALVPRGDGKARPAR
jgi:[glutamine synthetase] adenylyltransferase / [glutamine synthetase]-adenylyl-L-tyrosine phosphorylase